MANVTPLAYRWIHADALNRLARALYIAVVVQVLSVVLPQVIDSLTTAHQIDWNALGHSAISVGGQALGAYILRLLDSTKVPTPQPPLDALLAESVPVVDAPAPTGLRVAIPQQ